MDLGPDGDHSMEENDECYQSRKKCVLPIQSMNESNKCNVSMNCSDRLSGKTIGSTASDQSKVNHASNVDTKTKPATEIISLSEFKCQFCSETFKRKPDLEYHYFHHFSSYDELYAFLNQLRSNESNQFERHTAGQSVSSNCCESENRPNNDASSTEQCIVNITSQGSKLQNAAHPSTQDTVETDTKFADSDSVVKAGTDHAEHSEDAVGAGIIHNNSDKDDNDTSVSRFNAENSEAKCKNYKSDNIFENIINNQSVSHGHYSSIVENTEFPKDQESSLKSERDISVGRKTESQDKEIVKLNCHSDDSVYIVGDKKGQFGMCTRSKDEKKLPVHVTDASKNSMKSVDPLDDSNIAKFRSRLNNRKRSRVHDKGLRTDPMSKRMNNASSEITQRSDTVLTETDSDNESAIPFHHKQSSLLRHMNKSVFNHVCSPSITKTKELLKKSLNNINGFTGPKYENKKEHGNMINGRKRKADSDLNHTLNCKISKQEERHFDDTMMLKSSYCEIDHDEPKWIVQNKRHKILRSPLSLKKLTSRYSYKGNKEHSIPDVSYKSQICKDMSEDEGRNSSQKSRKTYRKRPSRKTAGLVLTKKMSSEKLMGIGQDCGKNSKKLNMNCDTESEDDNGRCVSHVGSSHGKKQERQIEVQSRLVIMRQKHEDQSHQRPFNDVAGSLGNNTDTLDSGFASTPCITDDLPLSDGGVDHDASSSYCSSIIDDGDSITFSFLDEKEFSNCANDARIADKTKNTEVVATSEQTDNKPDTGTLRGMRILDKLDLSEHSDNSETNEDDEPNTVRGMRILDKLDLSEHSDTSESNEDDGFNRLIDDKLDPSCNELKGAIDVADPTKAGDSDCIKVTIVGDAIKPTMAGDSIKQTMTGDSTHGGGSIKSTMAGDSIKLTLAGDCRKENDGRHMVGAECHAINNRNNVLVIPRQHQKHTTNKKAGVHQANRDSSMMNKHKNYAKSSEKAGLPTIRKNSNSTKATCRKRLSDSNIMGGQKVKYPSKISLEESKKLDGNMIVYKTRKTVLTKVWMHSEAPFYCCQECSSQYASVSDLHQHWLDREHYNLTKEPITASLHTCIFCGQKFMTEVMMRLHAKTCNQRYKELRKALQGNTTVSSSVLLSPNSDSLLYRCEICNRRYKSVSDLHQHWLDNEHFNLTVEPITSYLYTCSQCGKKFMTKVMKNLHSRACEGQPVSKNVLVSPTLGTSLYRCETCNRRFKSVSVLHQHWLDHEHYNLTVEPITPNLYTCSQCGKNFITKVMKNLHSEICGVPTKSFIPSYNAVSSGLLVSPTSGTCSCKCEMCNRRFNSVSGLHQHWLDKEHYNLTIEPVTSNLYTCSQCGTKFVTRVMMNLHSQTCGIESHELRTLILQKRFGVKESHTDNKPCDSNSQIKEDNVSEPATENSSTLIENDGNKDFSSQIESDQKLVIRLPKMEMTNFKSDGLNYEFIGSTTRPSWKVVDKVDKHGNAAVVTESKENGEEFVGTDSENVEEYGSVEEKIRTLDVADNSNHPEDSEYLTVKNNEDKEPDLSMLKVTEELGIENQETESVNIVEKKNRSKRTTAKIPEKSRSKSEENTYLTEFEKALINDDDTSARKKVKKGTKSNFLNIQKQKVDMWIIPKPKTAGLNEGFETMKQFNGSKTAKKIYTEDQKRKNAEWKEIPEFVKASFYKMSTTNDKCVVTKTGCQPLTDSQLDPSDYQTSQEISQPTFLLGNLGYDCVGSKQTLSVKNLKRNLESALGLNYGQQTALVPSFTPSTGSVFSQPFKKQKEQEESTSKLPSFSESFSRQGLTRLDFKQFAGDSGNSDMAPSGSVCTSLSYGNNVLKVSFNTFQASNSTRPRCSLPTHLACDLGNSVVQWASPLDIPSIVASSTTQASRYDEMSARHVENTPGFQLYVQPSAHSTVDPVFSARNTADVQNAISFYQPSQESTSDMIGIARCTLDNPETDFLQIGNMEQYSVENAISGGIDFLDTDSLQGCLTGEKDFFNMVVNDDGSCLLGDLTLSSNGSPGKVGEVQARTTGHVHDTPAFNGKEPPSQKALVSSVTQDFNECVRANMKESFKQTDSESLANDRTSIRNDICSPNPNFLDDTTIFGDKRKVHISDNSDFNNARMCGSSDDSFKDENFPSQNDISNVLVKGLERWVRDNTFNGVVNNGPGITNTEVKQQDNANNVSLVSVEGNAQDGAQDENNNIELTEKHKDLNLTENESGGYEEAEFSEEESSDESEFGENDESSSQGSCDDDSFEYSDVSLNLPVDENQNMFDPCQNLADFKYDEAGNVIMDTDTAVETTSASKTDTRLNLIIEAETRFNDINTELLYPGHDCFDNEKVDDLDKEENDYMDNEVVDDLHNKVVDDVDGVEDSDSSVDSDLENYEELDSTYDSDDVSSVMDDKVDGRVESDEAGEDMVDGRVENDEIGCGMGDKVEGRIESDGGMDDVISLCVSDEEAAFLNTFSEDDWNTDKKYTYTMASPSESDKCGTDDETMDAKPYVPLNPEAPTVDTKTSDTVVPEATVNIKTRSDTDGPSGLNEPGKNSKDFDRAVKLGSDDQETCSRAAQINTSSQQSVDRCSKKFQPQCSQLNTSLQNTSLNTQTKQPGLNVQQNVISSQSNDPHMKCGSQSAKVNVPITELPSLLNFPNAKPTVTCSERPFPNVPPSVTFSQQTLPNAQQTVTCSNRPFLLAQPSVACAKLPFPNARPTVACSEQPFSKERPFPNARPPVACTQQHFPNARLTVACMQQPFPNARPTVACSQRHFSNAEPSDMSLERTFSNAQATVACSRQTFPNAQTDVYSQRTFPNARPADVYSQRTFPNAQPTDVFSQQTFPNAQPASVYSQRTFPNAQGRDVFSQQTFPNAQPADVYSEETFPNVEQMKMCEQQDFPGAIRTDRCSQGAFPNAQQMDMDADAQQRDMYSNARHIDIESRQSVSNAQQTDTNAQKKFWVPKGYCYKTFYYGKCTNQKPCKYKHTAPTELDLRKSIPDVVEFIMSGDVDRAMSIMDHHIYYQQHLDVDVLNTLFDECCTMGKQSHCQRMLFLFLDRGFVNRGHIDCVIFMWDECVDNLEDLTPLQNALTVAIRANILPQPRAVHILLKTFAELGNLLYLWEAIVFCSSVCFPVPIQYTSYGLNATINGTELPVLHVPILRKVVYWLKNADRQMLEGVSDELLKKLHRKLEEMNEYEAAQTVQYLLESKHYELTTTTTSASRRSRPSTPTPLLSSHPLGHPASVSNRPIHPPSILNTPICSASMALMFARNIRFSKPPVSSNMAEMMPGLPQPTDAQRSFVKLLENASISNDVQKLARLYTNRSAKHCPMEPFIIKRFLTALGKDKKIIGDVWRKFIGDVSTLYFQRLSKNPSLTLDKAGLSFLACDILCQAYNLELWSQASIVLLTIFGTDLLELSPLVEQQRGISLVPLAIDTFIKNKLPDKAVNIIQDYANSQLRIDVKKELLTMFVVLTKDLCDRKKHFEAHQLLQTALKWNSPDVIEMSSLLIEGCLRARNLDIPVEVYDQFLKFDVPFSIPANAKRSMMNLLLAKKQRPKLAEQLFSDINSNHVLYTPQSYDKPRRIVLSTKYTSHEMRLVIKDYLQGLYRHLCEVVAMNYLLTYQDLNLTVVLLPESEMSGDTMVKLVGETPASLLLLKNMFLREFGLETVSIGQKSEFVVQAASLGLYLKDLDEKNDNIGLEFVTQRYK